jgi:hypothetical protein
MLESGGIQGISGAKNELLSTLRLLLGKEYGSEQ